MNSIGRPRPKHRRAVSTSVAAAVLLLGACSAPADRPETPVSPSTSEAGDATGAHHDDDGGGPAGLPSAHVHGVAVNPADGRVYLATHEGLFRYGDSGAERVGPVVDLMGFTVAGPDHFYASGHPGPGVDLPQPLGLVESTDAGRTWTPLSRAGESDFHALAGSDAGVVGFDGRALRATSDGRSWAELEVPVAPFALAVSPDGTGIVVTSEAGPLRSTDGGSTWSEVASAPLIQVVAFADATTAVGVTPDGTVTRSDDAGATWTQKGRTAGPPQAVGARRLPDGSLQVLVVTTDQLLVSLDGGTTFAPLRSG